MQNSQSIPTDQTGQSALVGCQIFTGDCIEVMRQMPESSINAIVTDPPYGLSAHSIQEVSECLTAWLGGMPYIQGSKKKGFMGQSWDAWVPGPEVWREALRVLKPGGHALIFAGTRSMDLMMMAVRLAGFEIRDSIGYAHDSGDPNQPGLMGWVYGSGFPKSFDTAKAIRASGDHENAEKWEGWGTALKPAWEPIIIARRPLEGTVANNVLKYGTGAINIQACRVPVDKDADKSQIRTLNRGERKNDDGYGMSSTKNAQVVREDGRFPANLVHDGSQGVLDLFPESKGQIAPTSTNQDSRKNQNCFGTMNGGSSGTGAPRGDAGSAARFFYCAKASPSERHAGLEKVGPQFSHGCTLRKIEDTEKNDNHHPTVKPVALLRYLLRLVTPPGGVALDPFAGSGSTGVAAINEGFDSILVERDAEYAEIARERVLHAKMMA